MGQPKCKNEVAALSDAIDHDLLQFLVDCKHGVAVYGLVCVIRECVNEPPGTNAHFLVQTQTSQVGEPMMRESILRALRSAINTLEVNVTDSKVH